MSAIILTDIRYNEHQFSLDYPVVDEQMICMAHVSLLSGGQLGAKGT